MAKFAQRQVELDFPRLYGLATIYLSSSLEAVVQNFIAALLKEQEGSLALDAVQRVKISLAEYEAMTQEERMLYIVEELEHDLRIPLRFGVTRFEALLDLFGLGGEVEEPVRKELFELTHVRNVLVHRNGIADRRIVTSCPWLDLRPGDKVLVGKERFERYMHAGSHYVSTVIMRVHAIFGERNFLVMLHQ